MKYFKAVCRLAGKHYTNDREARLKLVRYLLNNRISARYYFPDNYKLVSERSFVFISKLLELNNE